MNQPDATRGLFARPVLLAILGGWLIVSLLAIAGDWQTILATRFADGDDALRMVQVRALLAGQGWFDLHQYRIDAPAGVVMHWSRLVDLPLAATILALLPLLGQAGAEQVAAVLVPLLTLLAAQLCLGRIASRKLDSEAAWFATLLMLLMVPAMVQFQPLRIDHHGWQIVSVVAALNALLSTEARRGAPVAGVALAFGISVSLELLPFAALFALVFGLRWLADPAQRQWLVRYLDALALASIGFFLATRGPGDLTQYCDAVSPAYLAGLAATALAVRGIAMFTLPRPVLLGALGLAALVGAGAFLWFAPACTTGPFARLDPLVRSFWYDNVKEGMPVWRQDLAVMAQMLLPPLVGLQAAIRLARRERSHFWAEYAGLLGGAILISIAVSRFSGVSSAIAVVPLTWQVRAWARQLPQLRGAVRKAGLVLAICVLFMPSVAIEGATATFARITAGKGALPSAGNNAGSPPVSQSCSMPTSLAQLRRVPQGTILAQLDIGPFLLLQTDHRVVATGHHRASGAMHDVIAAFLAPPAQARAFAMQRHADYVLVCTDLVEAAMYRDRAPAGLAAQLLAGKRIDWLQPVPLGPGADRMRLWRVLR